MRLQSGHCRSDKRSGLTSSLTSGSRSCDSGADTLSTANCVAVMSSASPDSHWSAQHQVIDVFNVARAKETDLDTLRKEQQVLANRLLA